MVKFGQVVIGPPGSGKTTYCNEMGKFLTELGRNVAIINLDPANDILCYTAAIDVNELVSVPDVIECCDLGPNGALVYSIKYIEENIKWLLDRINKLSDNSYLLIDCPGQVELYTHYDYMKNIMSHLENNMCRFCTVHLVDSHYCSEPGKFISTVLLSLCSMLCMELPHINVLSKIDLLLKYGEKLAFNPDFYTDVLDLSYLLDKLQEDAITARYKKLNEALVSLVENYSLVTFIPLNIKDKKTLMKVKNEVDKATGYIFGSGEERNIQKLLSSAMSMSASDYDFNDEIKDKYFPVTKVEEGEE